MLGAAAMLSVGAFAAEADINDPAAAGYLPPQEQMVQGLSLIHIYARGWVRVYDRLKDITEEVHPT